MNWIITWITIDTKNNYLLGVCPPIWRLGRLFFSTSTALWIQVINVPAVAWDWWRCWWRALYDVQCIRPQCFLFSHHCCFETDTGIMGLNSLPTHMLFRYVRHCSHPACCFTSRPMITPTPAVAFLKRINTMSKSDGDRPRGKRLE